MRKSTQYQTINASKAKRRAMNGAVIDDGLTWNGKWESYGKEESSTVLDAAHPRQGR